MLVFMEPAEKVIFIFFLVYYVSLAPESRASLYDCLLENIIWMAIPAAFFTWLVDGSIREIGFSLTSNLLYSCPCSQNCMQTQSKLFQNTHNSRIFSLFFVCGVDHCGWGRRGILRGKRNKKHNNKNWSVSSFSSVFGSKRAST